MPVNIFNFLSIPDGILMRSCGCKIFYNEPITSNPDIDNPRNNIDCLQELEPQTPEIIERTDQHT